MTLTSSFSLSPYIVNYRKRLASLKSHVMDGTRMDDVVKLERFCRMANAIHQRFLNGFHPFATHTFFPLMHEM